MYGRRFHALKLITLKNEMDNSVRGYFGRRLGEIVVYVTHDPMNPRVTAQKKSIYKVSTRKGMEYARLVESYLKLKTEYDNLTRMWNSKYKNPVSSLDLSTPNLGVHKMDYEFWEKTVPYQNKYPYKTKLEYNGKIFRSKNEILAVRELDGMNIPYKIEPEVVFDDGSIAYPDLIIGVKAANKSAYIEVVGGVGMQDYNPRTAAKIIKYHENGYRDMRDIISIYLVNDMDAEYIRHQIKTALELMSPDV